MVNPPFKAFGYEISFLNLTISTTVGTKINLKNKTLIKLILRYIGLPHFGARLRAFYLGRFLNEIKLDSLVLDAGCGIGLNSFLAARKKLKIIGIDNDKEKISSAKQMLAQTLYPNTQFKLANILKLSDYKKTFDCVICFEVLEHIQNDDKAFHEISKVLKKGGILFLSIPGVGKISLLNQQSKHHVREGYTLNKLKEKLTTSNLRIRKVIGIEHTPLGLFLRFTNDAVHKKSLFLTTLFFFIFFPLAILDGLLPKIITPQNWIIIAEKN